MMIRVRLKVLQILRLYICLHNLKYIQEINSFRTLCLFSSNRRLYVDKRRVGNNIKDCSRCESIFKAEGDILPVKEICALSYQ